MRADRIEPGFTGRLDLDTLFRQGLRAITPNGVLGDPRGSRAEIGAELLDRLVDYLVERVRAQLNAVPGGAGPGNADPTSGTTVL